MPSLLLGSDHSLSRREAHGKGAGDGVLDVKADKQLAFLAEFSKGPGI